MLADGWKYWMEWNRITASKPHVPNQEIKMLEVDAGRNLGFVRVVSERPQSQEQEMWQPGGSN